MLPACPDVRKEWKRPTACHVIAVLHSAEKTMCTDMPPPPARPATPTDTWHVRYIRALERV